MTAKLALMQRENAHRKIAIPMLFNPAPGAVLGILTKCGLKTAPKALKMMTSSTLRNTTGRVKVLLMPLNLG